MARGRVTRTGVLGAVAATALLLGACVTAPEPVLRADREPRTPAASALAEEPRDSAPPAGARSPETPERPPGPQPSNGRPVLAELSVPTLGLSGLDVVPYRGRTDDAPGTRIQDAGTAASPYGPRGGVGPGGIGSYQVTGHRLSSTMPFRYLPTLRRGDEVRVDVGDTRYVYSIMGTRWTSFRSERSLREQRAAVPGRPGVEPRRAMITLSTCATVEDRAAGNFWADQFGNPEHRIDKIGVLERVVHR